MREVVFVDGMRTAFGKQGGTLRDIFATDLGALVVKALVEKTQILEKGGKVDSVMCGSAAHCPHSHSPARYVSMAAGLPFETSASYVEMQCGSAIDAINHAAWKILAGAADVVIAGGMESHSQKYVRYSTCVQPYKGLGPQVIQAIIHNDPAQRIPMIEVSDLMAQKWGITREACDEFAFRSQMRAAAAVEKGYFTEEIAPVVIPATKKTPEVIFDKDEHLRPTTTMEGLAKLKAVRGTEDSVTTAGNASGLNDGAAFVLMMTAEKAKELGYEPFARWVTGADFGVEPRFMGIGPAYSNLMAIQRAGLTVGDIDVFECNEAFAAQNLSVIKEMEAQSGATIDQAKWNPNGGAIAFGHPNGASGARIGIFCMKELARTGGRYGLFSSCCGGGQGVTTLIENLRR
ncbi:MAG: thiolase family protein [Oscillospiraceae bacterium]|nr:thiolase family protein [Oscillospiraceae bacterium]